MHVFLFLQEPRTRLAESRSSWAGPWPSVCGEVSSEGLSSVDSTPGMGPVSALLPTVVWARKPQHHPPSAGPQAPEPAWARPVVSYSWGIEFPLSFLQGQPSHDRPFSPFNLPFRASRGEMIFGLLVSWSSRTGSLKPFHGCSVGSPAIGGGSQDFLGSRLCWETPPWPGAPLTLSER